MSQSTVAMWEKGHRYPQRETMDHIAVYLMFILITYTERQI